MPLHWLPLLAKCICVWMCVYMATKQQKKNKTQKNGTAKIREHHATVDSIEMVSKAISVAISHCNPQQIFYADVQHEFTSVAVCRLLL